MNKEVAKRAVDIALQSPEKNLNFEFQGGEPLVNFDIIKFILEYSQEKKTYHNINYSIVSNLSLITDDMIDFCSNNHVGISTSLDGPKEVHNSNRPFIDGLGTFEAVEKGVSRVKNRNINIGAIQTTTRFSLPYAKEIVDQYLNFGFNDIFIRPLTPLGTAKDVWHKIGYTPDEFLAFYRQCIRYILDLNLEGKSIREGHAQLFLGKILRKQTSNYMELRSPCGAGIGQIAYYHNGDIYTCDEGRMIAEMGDCSFKLGNVFESDYNDLMSCDTCKTMCASSVLESLPGCCDCVYQPYCGVCPVINYAQEKNIFRRDVNNYRCEIYKGMLDIIFNLLYSSSEKEKEIIASW
jgi:His-Xaa-Ser system radical SAM maturase HxsB